jgi:hypothetical protein
MAEALPPHLARLNLPDALGEPLRGDSKDAGHGDAGQQVRNTVAAGERAFETDLAHPEGETLF